MVDTAPTLATCLSRSIPCLLGIKQERGPDELRLAEPQRLDRDRLDSCARNGPVAHRVGTFDRRVGGESEHPFPPAMCEHCADHDHDLVGRRPALRVTALPGPFPTTGPRDGFGLIVGLHLLLNPAAELIDLAAACLGQRKPNERPVHGAVTVPPIRVQRLRLLRQSDVRVVPAVLTPVVKQFADEQLAGLFDGDPPAHLVGLHLVKPRLSEWPVHVLSRQLPSRRGRGTPLRFRRRELRRHERRYSGAGAR